MAIEIVDPLNMVIFFPVRKVLTRGIQRIFRWSHTRVFSRKIQSSFHHFSERQGLRHLRCLRSPGEAGDIHLPVGLHHRRRALLHHRWGLKPPWVDWCLLMFIDDNPLILGLNGLPSKHRVKRMENQRCLMNQRTKWQLISVKRVFVWVWMQPNINGLSSCSLWLFRSTFIYWKGIRQQPLTGIAITSRSSPQPGLRVLLEFIVPGKNGDHHHPWIGKPYEWASITVDSLMEWQRVFSQCSGGFVYDTLGWQGVAAYHTGCEGLLVLMLSIQPACRHSLRQVFFKDAAAESTETSAENSVAEERVFTHVVPGPTEPKIQLPGATEELQIEEVEEGHSSAIQPRG